MSNQHIYNNPLSTFTFDFKRTKLLTKLLKCPSRFEDFCIDIFNGVSTSCNDVYIVDSNLVHQNNLEPLYLKPTLKGEHITRFHLPDTSPLYLLYINSEFKFNLAPNTAEYLRKRKDILISKSVEKRNGNRQWYELFRARNEQSLKIVPKIIIRQTGDSIIGAIDNTGYYSIDSTNVIILKKQYYKDCPFLLALLNSKLLKFFYQEISQEGGRVLAQIKPIRVRSLPIPRYTEKEKETILNLANDIINAKIRDTYSDISLKDNEIDKQVYHIYDLTYDEVLIVDPETPITREEYNNNTK